MIGFHLKNVAFFNGVRSAYSTFVLVIDVLETSEIGYKKLNNLKCLSLQKWF